jgi:hypothetical protein
MVHSLNIGIITGSRDPATQGKNIGIIEGSCDPAIKGRIWRSKRSTSVRGAAYAYGNNVDSEPGLHSAAQQSPQQQSSNSQPTRLCCTQPKGPHCFQRRSNAWALLEKQGSVPPRNRGGESLSALSSTRHLNFGSPAIPVTF